MLKHVMDTVRKDSGTSTCVPIRAASFPAPFRSGLEYASPARGTWNIVHTGMLIPEAHEIFVCGAGCLQVRGFCHGGSNRFQEGNDGFG